MISTDAAPNTPPGESPRDRATPERKRPLGWMIALGVAIIAAIALGAWALVLNDDLSDTQAELDARNAAAESASAEADRRLADARARVSEALAGIAGVVVVTDEDVAEAEQAAEEAEQAAQDAQDAADQTRAEAEQARADAEQAELCAQGALGATEAIVESDGSAEGYEEAADTLETTSSACDESLSK